MFFKSKKKENVVEDNEFIVNYKGDEDLKLAASYGHLKLVKFLVEQGADIHVDNDEPLRWAAENGHFEVVNYFRSVAGKKWKCHDCLVRATCLDICYEFNKPND